ncbi:hypothetical protein C3B59_17420 [Cryobacterium zongtaii]|uniref:Integral membrane protein n=2 Tax=Cryobacterium zongtaii TaxID=1259217 RepID=A0A2S3Z631_9MICO|nr:hypothetical protein C3B59_17420 [Cryobacterium zongtaii]
MPPEGGTAGPRYPRRYTFDPMIVSFVVIQGLLLSATMLIWTIAMVETVLAHFRITIDTVERASSLVVGGTAWFLIVGVVFNGLVTTSARAEVELPDRSGGGARTTRTRIRAVALIIANAAVIAGIATWLVRVNPGQIASWSEPLGNAPMWQWNDLLDVPFASTIAPFPVTDSNSPCYLDEDVVGCYAKLNIDGGGAILLDVLSVSILIGFFVSAFLAVLIYARALVTRFTARSDRREHSASLASGAFLIFGSWLLLVTFFSATRLGLFWFLELIGPFLPGSWYFPHLAQPYFIVLPYQLTPYDLSLANFMPLLGLLGLAAFAICAGLSGVFVKVGSSLFSVPMAKGSRSMRYLHRTVGALDRNMLGVIFATGMLFAGAIALFLVLYGELHRRFPTDWRPDQLDLNRIEMASGVAQLVGLLVTAIAVVTVAFITVSGGDGKLKQTLDIVADIAGFWPREWHPLAGASYRREVMNGLAGAIDARNHARVLLIGHSQGSVISFWYASHVSRIPGRIDLVTCGSPILTIYAALFPRWFNTRQNTETLVELRSWTNVWRFTDPIASPIPPELDDSVRGIRNLEAPDPADKSVKRTTRVRGHGNYWTDPVQTSIVAELAGTRRTSQ